MSCTCQSNVWGPLLVRLRNSFSLVSIFTLSWLISILQTLQLPLFLLSENRPTLWTVSSSPPGLRVVTSFQQCRLCLTSFFYKSALMEGIDKFGVIQFWCFRLFSTGTSCQFTSLTTDANALSSELPVAKTHLSLSSPFCNFYSVLEFLRNSRSSTDLPVDLSC